jgi:hypothetical protein
VTDDQAPMILRCITVSEVMHHDGTKDLEIESVGEPEVWDMLGMLTAAVESVRIDLARIWTLAGDDEDD